MLVLFKNVYDDVRKLFLLYFDFWSIYFCYFLGDKMGRIYKVRLLYIKVGWLFYRKYLYNYLSCELNELLCLWNIIFI